MNISGKLTYKLFSLGTSMLTAVATAAIARSTWKALRSDPPPTNPASPDTEWKDALVWTIATGITAGITRLLIMRGAAAGWRTVTGELPPMSKDAAY